MTSDVAAWAAVVMLGVLYLACELVCSLQRDRERKRGSVLPALIAAAVVLAAAWHVIVP